MSAQEIATKLLNDETISRKDIGDEDTVKHVINILKAKESDIKRLIKQLKQY